MNKFQKQITQKPTMWIIQEELGIHYPAGKGYTEYFDKKTKRWKKSSWETKHILLYSDWIEFVDFI